MKPKKSLHKTKTVNIFLLLIFSFLAFTASCKNSNDLIKPENSFKFKQGIISVFEDSKGNFWFGTKDKGVVKFDGESYVYFSKKDGLAHNQISNINEDQNGNMVFQTGSAISLYDGKSFTALEPQQSPLFINPWYLSDSSLWYATGANGVLKYNGKDLQLLKYPFQDSDSKTGVHSSYATLETYKDNIGKMWFGTFNQGVIEFDGTNFKKHNPDDFGIGTIRSIFQDNDGKHWFGSNGGGLYVYDGKSYRNFTKEKDLTSSNPGYDEAGTLSRIWAIEQDDKGNMWFGTADSGVWFYDGENITNYTTEHGLKSNFIDIIYKDNNGTMWFGSGVFSTAMLYRFDGKSFDVFEGFEFTK